MVRSRRIGQVRSPCGGHAQHLGASSQRLDAGSTTELRRADAAQSRTTTADERGANATSEDGLHDSASVLELLRIGMADRRDGPVDGPRTEMEHEANLPTCVPQNSGLSG